MNPCGQLLSVGVYLLMELGVLSVVFIVLAVIDDRR